MKCLCWSRLFIAFCAGLGLSSPLTATAQSWTPYGPGIVEELVTGAIDYASMRIAMEAKPDLLRARIEACGECSERDALERQLQLAERDRELISSMESTVARSMGMDSWTARKLGIKIFPPHVLKEPAPCIALYDRAFSCQVAHDDKTPSTLSSPCNTEFKLYSLCSKGEAKPFNEYVEFLRRKARGEFVSETDKENAIRFYNVKPGMVFPQNEVKLTPERNSYRIYIDNNSPNSLRSAYVFLSARVPLIHGNAEAFREPWRTIVDEDIRAIGLPPYLVCYYKLDDNVTGRKHTFWYRERPEAADPIRLQSRIKNHPLLDIGGPVDHCPETAPEAEALNPQLPYMQLKVVYKGMLTQ
ncbi:hypothetical protein EKL30_16165 [Candidimonas sp. SYP-B2681]|uniref:hypothetical protein n=1 Tax=Candidimonas sp. SYP-B2681 TaxID=2497686 RepID=UPI000F88EEEE|nr:hypothetical protein [Candidimonas sp. SYP-B2681]RTZ40656.1 hypothetical protein EKL30_16165 [Candidimonas sp. SYP-B2681]